MRAAFLSLLLVTAAPAASPLPVPASSPAGSTTEQAEASDKGKGPFLLPGREEDARVARIAFRLARSGVARCPASVPLPGIVLQHLTQFELADRPGMIAALGLDRGPAAIVVVPAGPAAQARMQAGDVLLAIDSQPLPPETGTSDPFSAPQAHARADRIHDMLERAAARPFTLTVLRREATHTLNIDAPRGCRSQVFLARSDQRNAYADGRHVFLTTGLIARLRNDDELAFLIAHEMAHNILGHAAIMRSGAVRSGIGRTLGRSGKVIRETERAADRLGTQLMLDAGFDPLTGSQVLQRLGGADLGIALFQEHDPVATRVAAIRVLVEAHGGQARGAQDQDVPGRGGH